MKPSKERRKIAQDLAIDAVYKQGGVNYQDKFNPYSIDSRQHEQFKTKYIKFVPQYHYLCNEERFMFEMHGQLDSWKELQKHNVCVDKIPKLD